MKHQPFLYKWTHIPTGKWYVGSRTAKKCHPNDGYICSSKYVKPMILKNPQEWKREILCIGSAEYIYDLETNYLKILDAANDENSFNRSNNTIDFKSSFIGKKHTKETKEKLSNRVITEDWRRKISESNKGSKLSEETKQKMSVTRKGIPKSKEHGRKIGDAHIGMKRSEQAKQNMRKPKTKVTCPHCALVGGSNIMRRYHFDNCKFNSSS